MLEPVTPARFFWKRRSTKQKVILVVVGLAILALGYCALNGGGLGTNILNVSLINDYSGFPGDTIEITSRVNQITLNNVVANRGNCSPDLNYAGIPRTLTYYGQTIDIPTDGCNVIEVTVDTDQGAGSFEFNPQ